MLVEATRTLFLFFLLFCQSCLAITLREEMLLTDEEQQGFERFKAQAVPLITTEYMKKDLVLLKYFRYCDMNETKAMALLIDNLQWRIQWGFEALSEDELNNYLRLYPFTTFQDKSGRGVFFVVGKYWDVSAACRSMESTKSFVKFAYHVFEETYKKGVSNTTNRTSSGMVGLFDLKDTELAKHYCPPCVKLLEQIYKETEYRWPGGIQAGYLVNVHPFILPGVDLVKRTLSEKLQKMSFIFDEDDIVWMPELLKIIVAEKIPGDLYLRSQHQAANPQPPSFAMFPVPPQTASAQSADDGKDKGKKTKTKKKSKKGKKDDDDDDDN